MSEEMQIPPVRIDQGYVFPSAYGGASQSPNPPLIHQAMMDLRKEVNFIAAKRQPGVPFPVRGAKDLSQKLAEALVKLGMAAPVIDQDITHLETTLETVGANKAGNGPSFRTLVHVKAKVRLIAPDGSYCDMVGSGHGADSDDKGGGKASTYAWKDALLKGLTIPDAEMQDTDDEVHTPTPLKLVPAATDTPKESHAKKVIQFTEGKTDVRGLEYALSEIDRAKDLEALTVVQLAIKNGDIVLASGDKLKASAAYVAKRKELKGE